jgi:O-methyltransferase involved in polyketide biosynthesis
VGPFEGPRPKIRDGGGVSLHAATFFSWLGVTQYLSSDAVLGTLGEIARLAASGSQIVFQFVVSPATLSGEEQSLVLSLASHAAQVGEPWLSFSNRQKWSQN